MNLEEVLNFRRSVRRYDKNKPIDPEKVKHCLELATLAPNSSNMQLWEAFITNWTPLKKRGCPYLFIKYISFHQLSLSIDMPLLIALIIELI